MKEDSSEYGKQFYLPVFLTILTIALGLLSFHMIFPDYPFLRKLYYAFQLFTLESGDYFYDKGLQPLIVKILYNLARYLAVATLIITIVLAILSVLRYKYMLSRIRFMSGHTIICGMGEVGEAIAENFKDKKRLVIIEKDISDENLAVLRKAGVKIIEANALDISVLDRTGLKRAKSLSALTGDDFVNLTIINQALDLLKDKQPGEESVMLSANIDSRNLKVAITDEWKKERNYPDPVLRINLRAFLNVARSIESEGGFEKAGTELTREFNRFKAVLLDYNPAGEDNFIFKGFIRLFNINQLAARYIFRTYPPDRFRSITGADDPEMNILILGYSKIGEELMKLCFQNCHYLNRKNARITLISPEADSVMTKIKSIYKTILNVIDFQAVNMNPHHLTGSLLIDLRLVTVDVIYVCSGEDRYQASYSSRATELYGDSIAIVRPFYRNKAWNRINPQNNLHTFNILSNVAKLEDIIDEYFDRKAIAVHHRWLKQEIARYLDIVTDSIEKNKVIPDPKPTLVPWHQLDEEFRDDNRSVVEHMNIKLRSAGQLTDPAMYANPEKVNINYGFLMNPVLVEQLAEMEHRRWMATKFLYGWNSGETRDHFQRKHEGLVDFGDLDPLTRQLDIDQVKAIKEIIDLK